MEATLELPVIVLPFRSKVKSEVAAIEVVTVTLFSIVTVPPSALAIALAKSV